MKCGIITSVDPRDSRANLAAVASIDLAMENGLGPFTSVETIVINNPDGKLSRSACLNLGVEKASVSGCEWIFILSESSLIFVDAFTNITELAPHHDAIWGLICDAPDESLQNVGLRDNQWGQLTSIQDVMDSDPDSSLQMSFFMRTSLAMETRFEESLAGVNEFRFFLHCWENHRCIRGNFILSIEIHGEQWEKQRALSHVLRRAAAEHEIRETRRRIMAMEIDSSEKSEPHYKLLFTVGTLVSDVNQYDLMLKSFANKGFSKENTEFIYMKNSDPCSGLNDIIAMAQGKYILLARQDIVLHDDDFDVLVSRLAELDKVDPKWALAGNSGGGAEGFRASRMTYVPGVTINTGVFPVRVSSLDENLIIIRHKNKVAFSRDIRGPHFYATDICLNADMAGYAAYVINFHLMQAAVAIQSQDFLGVKKMFEHKWGNAFRPRAIQTSQTILDIEPVTTRSKGWSSAESTSKCSIFQIFYDAKTREQVAPEFLPLDNTSSERQDWYEFWPIRQALAKLEMDEDHFYGFLSPKFSTKTGFSPCEVISTVNAVGRHVDVILLSSHLQDLIIHKNPFIQGDKRHSNLMSACEHFFDFIGKPIDLNNLITTLDNSVFSNYIVAKPSYWRKWRALADQFFDYAENRESLFYKEINSLVDHRDPGSVHLKVFIQERLATFLLVTETFNVFVPDYFRKLKIYDNGERAGVLYLENLKNAYLETRDVRCLQEYEKVLKSRKISTNDVHDLSLVFGHAP